MQTENPHWLRRWVRTTPWLPVFAAVFAAALAGCAGDGATLVRSGVPQCDRNGDQEQRVACDAP